MHSIRINAKHFFQLFIYAPPLVLGRLCTRRPLISLSYHNRDLEHNRQFFAFLQYFHLIRRFFSFCAFHGINEKLKIRHTACAFCPVPDPNISSEISSEIIE